MSIALPAEARERLEELPARSSAVYQALVRASGAVTTAELHEATALHERTVQRALKQLREHDLAEQQRRADDPEATVYATTSPEAVGGEPPRYQV